MNNTQQELVEAKKQIYNTVRPHQSLGSPQQFLLRGSSQRKE